MSIVGSAEILVLPITTGFESELRKQTSGGLKGFEKDAGESGALAGANLRGGVTKETGKLGDDLEKHGRHAGSRFASTLTLGFAGAAVGIALFSGKVAESMQSAEASIASASGTSVASAAKIGSALESTAGKSEFSAVEMAKAYAGVAGQLKETEGRALSSGQALKVMSAAGDLASAKQIDLGTATKAVAGTMQAFQLKAGDAAHVSDVLYRTSVATGQGVDTLSTQLERVRSKLGETAGSVGNLSALMVDLTDQGITGRGAMAALNGAMNGLLKPTKQATEESKKLGLQTFDSSGKFVGLGKVIEELHPKFASMTEQQRLQAATSLFGASAGRQMLAVIQAGPQAFNKASDAVNRHGAAQSAAARQAATLHGEEKTLGAEVTDLAGRVGSVLIPIVISMVGAFTKASTFVLDHKAVLIALGVVVTSILAPAIAVFTINKMAQFSQSFKDASSHVKSFASDVESVVKRVMAAFVKQDAAAATSATKMKTATGKASGAVATEATEIEGSTATVDSSFAGTAASAKTAATEIGTAEAATTSEVVAADSTIEADNAAAGGSFASIAGGARGALASLGPLLGALGVVGAAFPAAKALQNAGVLPTQSGGAHGAPGTPSPNHNLPTPGNAVSGPGNILGVLKGLPGIGGLFHAGDTNQRAPTGQQGPTGPVSSHMIHGAGDVSASIASAGIGGLSASQNAVARELMGLFTSAGLSPAGAAGIVGNWVQESSLNPGEPGGFLAQWGGSRLSALTARYGSNPTAAQQGQFALSELQGYPGLLRELKTTSNPTQAALDISQQYERPATWAANNPNREAQARAALAAYGGVRGTGGAGGGFSLPAPITAAQIVAEQAAAAAKLLAKERAALAVTIAKERAEVDKKVTAERASVAGKGHTPAQRAAVERMIADQKGALNIEIAQQKASLGELTSKQSAELKKQTSDAKAGSTELSKLLKDVHSTNLKTLTTDLNKTHNAALKQIEKALDRDHNSALRLLSKDLVAVHKAAMAELVKQEAIAAAKAATAAEIQRLSDSDKVTSDQAKASADQIADSTKVYLDQQAEAGQTGAALAAAQAQTGYDQVVAANDQAIDAAQVKVDQSVHASALQQAQAASALNTAQATATVQEAQAQSFLDKANAASQAASTAASSSTTPAATTPAVAPVVEQNFTIIGSGLDANGIMTEINWAVKTGALPVAPPPLIAA